MMAKIFFSIGSLTGVLWLIALMLMIVCVKAGETPSYKMIGIFVVTALIIIISIAGGTISLIWQN